MVRGALAPPEPAAGRGSLESQDCSGEHTRLCWAHPLSSGHPDNVTRTPGLPQVELPNPGVSLGK